jgi:hypothetical protein
VNEDIIIKNRGERANRKRHFFLSEGDLKVTPIDRSRRVVSDTLVFSVDTDHGVNVRRNYCIFSRKTYKKRVFEIWQVLCLI